MLLKKKSYLFLILLLVPLAGFFMNVHPLDSDFDKFARNLFHRLGQNSTEPIATGAVLQYLEENGIDDPIAFLKENMDVFSPGKKITADDLPTGMKEKMLDRGAISYLVFAKTFKLRTLIGYKELRIIVYEKADGGVVMDAFLFIHTL